MEFFSGEEQRIGRPQQRYTGAARRDYVRMADRGLSTERAIRRRNTAPLTHGRSTHDLTCESPPSPARRARLDTHCCFRIASGEMLGPERPIALNLMEITPALGALSGVVMELNDCAYPLLQDVVTTDDPAVAFKDVDYAILVGAKPRGKGMERGDLLAENGRIFGPQGRALNDHASRGREGAGDRQSREYQRAHRDAERVGSGPGAVLGHDAARSQPGHQPSGGEDRGRDLRHSARDDLGQSLRDPSIPT